MTENNNNQIYHREEESAIQLADLWVMIWDHKWWYVASAAICLCFGLAYLYRTPDTYLRSAKVIIDESGQDAALSTDDHALGGFGEELPSNGFRTVVENIGKQEENRTQSQGAGCYSPDFHQNHFGSHRLPSFASFFFSSSKTMLMANSSTISTRPAVYRAL